MNLNKHREFFDPVQTELAIHIIGVGAVGSTIAEQLVRLGLASLHIYDMDIVTEHNLTNQMYYHHQKGVLKTTALRETLERINPEVYVVKHEKGYIKQPLGGIVFLCVDSIDLRRKIVENNQYNPNISAMFDCRMELTGAQHYAADWKDPYSIQVFLDSMQFSSAEAKAQTPVSACGTSLSINPTVRTLSSYCISNYINFINTGKLKKFIIFDAFSYDTYAI